MKLPRLAYVKFKFPIFNVTTEALVKLINRAVAEAIVGLANIFSNGNTHAVLLLNQESEIIF